jgi:hypothetical protein
MQSLGGAPWFAENFGWGLLWAAQPQRPVWALKQICCTIAANMSFWSRFRSAIWHDSKLKDRDRRPPEGGPVSDLQSFPVLTQDFSPTSLLSASGPAKSGVMGGTPALRMAADKPIREVLNWRTRTDDPKGFIGALNQENDLKEVEGHTENTWTPRSYTVQTDMGAVTGEQASIYTRAKVALDQSMPLLDGLYPLIPCVEPEGSAAVQSVVRTQFTALANEFGVVGCPRVPRVDELFDLLLGPGSPSNPEDIMGSRSLGLVRLRFGLERKYVTTVDDEQNLTNYLILVDCLTGLKKSWDFDKSFFVRTTDLAPG